MESRQSFLKEVATEGVNIRVNGSCMSPCLIDGSRVRIAAHGRLLPGDVVAYIDANGRMVLHRLIGYYRRRGIWKLLLQADSARRPDPGVGLERALGKVVDIRIPFQHRLRAVGRYARFAVATLIGRTKPQFCGGGAAR